MGSRPDCNNPEKMIFLKGKHDIMWQKVQSHLAISADPAHRRSLIRLIASNHHFAVELLHHALYGCQGTNGLLQLYNSFYSKSFILQPDLKQSFATLPLSILLMDPFAMLHCMIFYLFSHPSSQYPCRQRHGLNVGLI